MQQRSFEILVVDDDALLGLDLGDIIETAGHVVIGPFLKPSDALTVLQTCAADAAIIDVQLQNEDHQTLASALRQRAIPFAVHTGLTHRYPPDGPFEGALRLAKPASRQDLLAMLDRLCTAPSRAAVTSSRR